MMIFFAFVSGDFFIISGGGNTGVCKFDSCHIIIFAFKRVTDTNGRNIIVIFPVDKNAAAYGNHSTADAVVFEKNFSCFITGNTFSDTAEIKNLSRFYGDSIA
ncbi:hypothetical protein SDC9_173299 [bioreactor metagenome]|uniref:Uncharacterized protein n=1 Tax=bioreactor metagenome TaxID=1076179 RepID=A0A645GG08_9ZZZZ